MLRLVLIALALCASASIAHSSPARLDRLDARSNTSHVSPESAIAPRRLETREFERRATSSRSKRAKKGLGINSQADVSAFGASVSWAYDWRVEERRSKRIDRRRSPVPPGGPGKALGNGVQFVPMLWGAKQVPGFAANVRAAVKANGNGLSPYLLGFNEPDLVRLPRLAYPTASLGRLGLCIRHLADTSIEQPIRPHTYPSSQALEAADRARPPCQPRSSLRLPRRSVHSSRIAR